MDARDGDERLPERRKATREERNEQDAHKERDQHDRPGASTQRQRTESAKGSSSGTTDTRTEPHQREQRKRTQHEETWEGRNAKRRQPDNTETGTQRAEETRGAHDSDTAIARHEAHEPDTEAQRRRLGKRKETQPVHGGAEHREPAQRPHTEELCDTEYQDGNGARSAKRQRESKARSSTKNWMQQNQQQSTTAMLQEPSSAQENQQLDQDGDEDAHNARNEEGASSGANDDTPAPPQHDAEADSTRQRSGDPPNHGLLVGAQGSQEETVSATGRGHTRRKPREFFPGIVRDTPRPVIRHASPPTGPRKRKWEGTYMTPHKARRGALKHAIRVGPQLVTRLETSDERDQQ